MNIEKRFFNVELRATDPDSDNEQSEPRIEGYAAVFNSPSELMWGFREVMEPGFFDDCLNDDVRALFNHNRDFVLGRSAAQTLSMAQDAKGLKVDIDPPDTDLVRDLVLTPMKRGDINQMSFAFELKPGGDDWKQVDGQLIRVLKKGGCLRLHDVSVVTEPAYPETSASVRSKLSEYQQASPADGQESAVEGAADERLQERTFDRRRRLAIAG